MKKRNGYTLSEVLIVLILISIFFAILIAITDTTLRAYQTTKSTLQLLYAQSYVDFLFDVLEGELKWAGSGSSLLLNQDPNNRQYSPSPNGILLKPDGTPYYEIVNRLWLRDSIDIEKTATGFIIYITYLITTPVTFKYDQSLNGYTPISEGYIDYPGWCILKNALSPSAEKYTPRYAKLKFYKNGITQVTSEIYVKPGDRFVVKEVDPSNPSVEMTLNPYSSAPKYKDYFYIVPIARFKNIALNNGYVMRSFRQIRVEYNSQTKEVFITRFLPATDLTQNTYRVKIIDNVESFEGSLVYYSAGQFNEIRFDNRSDWNTYKNSTFMKNIKDYIVGLKFTITWKAPWKNLSENDSTIVKTRLITLPNAIQ